MKRFLIALILLFFWAAPLQAAYMYQFDYQFDGLADDTGLRTGSLSFMSEDLLGLGNWAVIEPGDLLWGVSDSKYPFTELIFNTDLEANRSRVRMAFDLSGAPSSPGGMWWNRVDWFFEGQSFDAPGVYVTDWGRGATLTISSVPEPATLMLLGLGIVAVAAARRRLHK